MAADPLIVEDGTCVDGANTFATIECARAYWSNRFGGEMWDMSYEGKNHCDGDIIKALIGAIDYLNGLSWGEQGCTENSCVPTPIQCACDGKSAISLMKEAQIIIADALLRGWNPYARRQATSRPVISMSSPEEGSVTFARPVTLECYTSEQSADIGREVRARIRGILGPLLRPKSKGRRVLS